MSSNKIKNSSLVYPGFNEALCGETVEEFKKKLVHALKGRVEQIYLFGSYARGDARGNSDIDIMIVAKTGRPFFERYKDFDEVYNLTRNVDLLIYTPEEFSKLISEAKTSKSGFWSHVVDTMIPLL